MKDYRLYGVHDFLMDEYFIEWVGIGHKQGNEFWEQWLAANPEKYIVFEEAKRIIQGIRVKESIVTEGEKQAAANRLLANIRELDENLHIETENTTKAQRIPFTQLAVAALVVGLLSSGIYYLQNHGRDKGYSYENITLTKKLVEKSNTTAKTINLTLPDGSTVQLEQNSKIAYQAELGTGAYRDVILNGDAFFEIQRNPAMPFRVFADEIVTKALGTSFWVRKSSDSKKITVTVVSGKVSVVSLLKETPNGQTIQAKEAILTPNQELLYEKDIREFKKGIIENPGFVMPLLQDELVYNESLLIDAFVQLEAYYGIKILYDIEALTDCTLTADLRKISFYEALSLICAAIGASYEIIDGQVVINSKGC